MSGEQEPVVKPCQRGKPDRAWEFVDVQVEGREQELKPSHQEGSAVGMTERPLEEIAVAAIDDARRTRRYMVENAAISGADRAPRNAGPMGLAAILDDVNASG